MRFLFFILIVFFAKVSYAQISLDTLTKENYITDFNLVVDIFKRNHPNPFKFTSEKEFDIKVDSLKKKLEANPNIYSFLYNFPTKIVNDVHIDRIDNNDWSNDLLKRINFFPYPVFIHHGRVFINVKNYDIPFGAEIINIDREPVGNILKEIAILPDGRNPSLDRIRDFMIYLSLRSNNLKRNYSITYIDPNSKIKKTIKSSALNFKDFYYRKFETVYPYNLAALNFENIFTEFDDQKNLGIITVNTFDLNESYAYKAFSKFFKEANKRKCREVIIDVRKNLGGDPSISALLYSFIAKESFSNVFHHRTNTIKLDYDEFRVEDDGRKKNYKELEDSANFLYQRFDKDSSGRYVGNNRLMEGNVVNYPKDKDAYTGKIKVLVGSETISSAVYFAALVKKNNRGLILGRETASGMDATTAVWFSYYRLPHTGMYLKIPASEIYFFNEKTDRGRGLIPDSGLTTEQFMSYVMSGKDPEMTFAIEECQ